MAFQLRKKTAKPHSTGTIKPLFINRVLGATRKSRYKIRSWRLQKPPCETRCPAPVPPAAFNATQKIHSRLLDGWPGIQKYVGIEWLQFVPFVEVGRVAPVWNFERLHCDMKWSAGLGIRALAKGIVIRIDTALSDEGAGVKMMISQPFQF